MKGLKEKRVLIHSDMFSAHLYKPAAFKVGAPDYKELVRQNSKLQKLYRSMVDQFHQSGGTIYFVQPR